MKRSWIVLVLLIVLALLICVRGLSITRAGDRTETLPAGGWKDGAVLAFSPDYLTDHTLFAGGEGGVFKSTDGGTTWRPASTGLTHPACEPNPCSVGHLALSPGYSADTTLFAGTAFGVFKSTDSGASWQEASAGLGGPLFRFIGALALSPAYGSDHTLFIGKDCAGVFKSTDAGASWTPTGLWGGCVSVLSISPDYASNSTLFAGSSNGEVFRSTDGGDSWSAAKMGLVEQ